jgi:hypothetical protein
MEGNQIDSTEQREVNLLKERLEIETDNLKWQEDLKKEEDETFHSDYATDLK